MKRTHPQLFNNKTKKTAFCFNSRKINKSLHKARSMMKIIMPNTTEKPIK